MPQSFVLEYDPSTTTEYDAMRRAWCLYNGMRATPKQIARVVTLRDRLAQMLADRGVSVRPYTDGAR